MAYHRILNIVLCANMDYFRLISIKKEKTEEDFLFTLLLAA